MRSFGTGIPVPIHRNLLETDDYTPVLVQTTEDFEGVLDMFPYVDLATKRAAYPKRLPFSAMVYQIFNQIKSYVERCTNYADRLNLRFVCVCVCVCVCVLLFEKLHLFVVVLRLMRMSASQ